MTIRRRLTIGLAWMFAGNWAGEVCNLIVFIVLARLLGASSFGLAMMAIAFVILAEGLVRETMTEFLIQHKDVKPGHLDAVFWLLAGVSVALVLCLVLLANVIAAIYSEPQVADLLRWAAPTIIFIGLSGVPVALLRRDLDFGMLAVRTTVGIVCGGIVGIYMAIAGYGAWSLVGQRLVQVFVINVLAWFAKPWRPGFQATPQQFREVWGFGAKMLSLRASEIVSLQTPTVIIGSLLGATPLGHFTIAFRMVEVMSSVLTVPVRFVSQSTFARLQENLDQAGALLRDITQFSSLIASASFLGLAAVAAPTISFVFGPEWEPSIPLVQVMSLVGIYLSIERLQQALCLAFGQPGPLLTLSVAEAVLGIVLMVIAAPYGLIAVAIAFTARFYILWPFRFRIVKNIVAIDLAQYIGTLALPVGLALLMVLGVLVWQFVIGDNIHVIALLGSSVFIGMLIYAGAVALTMPTYMRRAIQLLKDARRTEPISTGGNGVAD